MKLVLYFDENLSQMDKKFVHFEKKENKFHIFYGKLKNYIINLTQFKFPNPKTQ